VGLTQISIDGPTASGKSTLGRWLADHLLLPFLDTGWTYRAVALGAGRLGRRPNSDDVEEILHSLRHQPYVPGISQPYIELGKTRVWEEIWTERCNGVLPWISDAPEIRHLILDFHRAAIEANSFIVAGRDVASTLLLDARPKIFLEASYAIRRERRRRQIEQGGLGTPVAGPRSKTDLESRQKIAQDPAGLILDTTSMSIDQVQEEVGRYLERGIDAIQRR